MAMLARSILGVDITPYEIRVVEVQGTGANVQVLRAGSAPLPPGALEGDRIAEPVPVAEILHELIGRLEVGTRQAILGVGAHSVITRVLEIPRVPDHEVRTVVEGELAYYKILGEGTGAFDFMRLPDPEPGSDTPPQVLLMAMEDRIAGGYREVAERAGLTLLALEPVLLAIYRMAFPQLLAQRTRVCLAVSYARSEITVVEEGRIRLYRQVDVGSDHLIDGRPRPGYGAAQTSGLGDRFLLSGEEEQESTDLTSEFDGPINPFAANDLASELQRSIEY